VQGLQERIGVADVRLDQGKRMRRQILDTLLLDGTGIEGIEVVDGRNPVAVVQEATAEVAADEASAAGDENMHGPEDSVRRSAGYRSVANFKSQDLCRRSILPSSTADSHRQSLGVVLSTEVWGAFSFAEPGSLLWRRCSQRALRT
jgi:hypothetical protein